MDPASVGTITEIGLSDMILPKSLMVGNSLALSEAITGVLAGAMIYKSFCAASHSKLESIAFNRKSNGLSEFCRVNRSRRYGSTLLMTLVCALGAFPVHAVTDLASNLRLTVNGGTAVLRWNGTTGVLYQAEGTTGLGSSWQAIGSPTTDFAVTNLVTGPVQMYRVGIYTNTPQYV